MEEQQTDESGQRVFIVRLLIGLVQGVTLYFLYFAHDHQAWPATDSKLFAPLALVFLFVPLLALQGIGNLRKRTLLSWVVLAAAIAAGFAFYDVWHAWPADTQWVDGKMVATPHVMPSANVVVFTAVFLFVAHALISCAEADRRIVPRYPVLFDLAWKLGVQVAIAACFVGSFWIILGLGMALFEMIKLHFFREFVQHSWFAIPATTLATAVSIHITDTRASLVRGVRTLALMLLGWLLPVIALIAFVFLISLVFTGLQPLWQTRSATALLLVATAVLVIHINAAYQDGDPVHRPHHVLRVAGTLASILLIFIVSIAAYALWLRVDQYGWSVDRIYTAACALVALSFALGYFVAALLPTPWLKLIETWNFLTTILGLVILFALFTPIADPMRLSVADQMERLSSGKVKPESFDFSYLRWQGGRFGRLALIELSYSKNARVKAAATATLYETHHYARFASVPSATNLAANIKVFPLGKSLPSSFVAQSWSDSSLVVGCRDSAYFRSPCDAIVKDFDGDGADDIFLIHNRSGLSDSWWTGELYKLVGKEWQQIALAHEVNCKGDREALLAGKFKLVAPLTRLPDIEVNGRRVTLVPTSQFQDCNKP